VNVVAHGSTHDRHGRIARLLLLLATLFGLAAMHTLGHHGPHLPAGHHSSHPATMADNPAADGVIRAADACGTDRCGTVLAAPISGGHGLAGWDVCVAVLVGFAVLLLAAGLLRSGRAAGTAHRTGRSGPARPRAPPPVRVGLTFATVSVLRT
jgi:hypothetical protein